MSLTKVSFEKLSLKDALDLAILIEEEAMDRYNEFVNQLGHRYPGDAADFFKRMSGYEAKHAADLKVKRESLFGKSLSQINLSMIWDVEAPSEGAVRAYMSLQQAMEVAMEGEKKAYQFFDEALEHVNDKEVKALFEELREEEKEHLQGVIRELQKLPISTGPDLDEDDLDEPSQL